MRKGGNFFVTECVRWCNQGSLRGMKLKKNHWKNELKIFFDEDMLAGEPSSILKLSRGGELFFGHSE